MRRTFPIFLPVRRDPPDSALYCERRARFRVFRTNPGGDLSLLKTNLFCVASLTCELALALAGTGYTVLASATRRAERKRERARTGGRQGFRW